MIKYMYGFDIQSLQDWYTEVLTTLHLLHKAVSCRVTRIESIQDSLGIMVFNPFRIGIQKYLNHPAFAA